jgi:hypothetical protein
MTKMLLLTKLPSLFPYSLLLPHLAFFLLLPDTLTPSMVLQLYSEQASIRY